MNVLFLTNQMNVGGIEKNIVRLTQELQQRGHQVMTASGDGALVPEITEVKGQHYRIDFAGDPRALIRSVNSLAHLVESYRPDVIHTFSAPCAIAWFLARSLLRVKAPRSHLPSAVSSIMGLQNSPDEPSWKTRLRVLLSAAGARRLIIMAPAIDQVARSLPLRDGRLVRMSVVGVHVPHDLSWMPRAREDVRAELKVGREDRVILSIGNLEPRKSHELFIRAAREISRRRQDVHFFIAGEGVRRPYLEQEIAACPDPSRVTLLGTRHDTDRLLAACDVYVRPGIVEGFIGITVLEAQALQIPVVAFDLADVRLAIEDGLTGKLVSRGDHMALANAVTELLEDRDLARKIGEAGREHVRANYSIPHIVDRLEELYSTVVA